MFTNEGKILLIVFCAADACRGDELVNLETDPIEDVGSTLVITIPSIKTKISRTFVVTKTKGNINILDLYRKYVALRPSHTSHRRFFTYYKNGKCTTQPVRKNTMQKIPNIIATYLNLLDPTSYTGHCMWRSSATLLADVGADITTIKRNGGWKSTTVAESYLESLIENKTNMYCK